MLYGEIGNDVYLITGESGNDLITVSGFARQVSRNRSQWPEHYVERMTREVLSGECDSVMPAAGSDVFYVRKSGEAVIASTRPNEGDLMTFELTGEAA